MCTTNWPIVCLVCRCWNSRGWHQLTVYEFPTNYDSSSPASAKLAVLAAKLTKSSMWPSSILTYRRAWSLYCNFLSSVLMSESNVLPLSPSVLALFVAHFFDRKYARATINTFLAVHTNYRVNQILQKFSTFTDAQRSC